MKKAVIFFSVSVLTGLGLPFSLSASTIYQQLADSAAEVDLADGCSFPNYTELATFEVPTSMTLTAASFFYGSFYSETGANTTITLGVASTSVSGLIYSFALANNFDPDVDVFLEIPYVSGTNVLVSGYTYSIIGCDNTADVTTRSNLSSDFVFGYLTSDGISSVPLVPGITGFTDVGISTTSQQIWCNQNFSTTTGLLDNLGQSISLGICNVGVFLFVPNTSAISQFTTGWTTLTTSNFPFSWITNLRDILDAYVATSTENFPSLTIAFGTSTSILGMTSLEVISTSTIGTYLSDSTRESIQLLLATIFYLLAASFVYRNLQNVWHKRV